MRIMLLITCLQLGGAEQQVAALAMQYRLLGHAVSVVSLMPGCELTLPEGVEVLMLNMRKTPAALLGTLMQIRRFVLRWRPDIVHSHLVHANLMARLLTRVCTVPATICTAHNYFEGGALRMLGYRLTDRWADLTTQVSEEGRQRMIEVRAAPASRIVYVPNGFDTTRYRPSAGQRSDTRAELGLRPGDRLILNVGRLVPDKAQTTLIDAFAQASFGDDTVLMIAGEGPQRDALARRIEQHGLTGRVILLGKRMDVPALLNAADLFVLSSLIEGMPLVVGEALASGCPVVATDASGVPAMVRGIGTLVPRGDTPALARAIRDAVSQGRGGPVDEAARHEHIATSFNIRCIARDWLRLYASYARAGAPAQVEVPDAVARYR
ncbi:glycosyltransferase [Cupriavidus consociatus]|uniref:glycosyltransferase n=1 Tax=Cupriavidus consociatus TaxID=2821357 RepID=UPI001AE39685|nr:MULTISPECIES: glycosyltransferase [unclassified Cupriavidus]MBP0623545.1 glycosyltransferase [Cupriavidus sp. LEh25]MDK2660246.1 glycosyltransferase [Cupriavidus sp. LEh21]